MTQNDIFMSVEVDNGKYKFILSKIDWRVHCLRYGEPWVIFEQGDKALIALMSEFEKLQETINSFKKEQDK